MLISSGKRNMDRHDNNDHGVGWDISARPNTPVASSQPLPVLYSSQEDCREEHVNFNGKMVQITFFGGVGYILSKDLEIELLSCRNLVSRATWDIILEHLPIRYALETQLKSFSSPEKKRPSNLFETIVALPDAVVALEMLVQHQKNSNGLKYYGNWGGIATFLWSEGSIVSPYVNIEKECNISMDMALKMNLKGLENVTGRLLDSWERANILIQQEKLERNRKYCSRFPKDVMVISLSTIQRLTGVGLRMIELDGSTSGEHDSELVH